VFVIARKYGQLGNRLRRAAHLLAAAMEHGHTFVDLAFSEYADLFESTRRDAFCRYPPGRRRLPAPGWLRALQDRLATVVLRVTRFLHLSGGFLRAVVWRDVDAEYRLDAPEFGALARSTRILLFEGWTFRTAALERRAPAIRAHFTPAREKARKVDALVAALRARAEVLVGVHVRLGDYATWSGGRYFWPLSAYAAMMRKVQALHAGREVLFLVCSNERVDLASFGELPCAAGTDDPVVDLYALARCDYLFGPPSSFTLWASFYGGVPLWVPQLPGDEPALGGFVPRSV
jgi:hypothetical protein